MPKMHVSRSVVIDKKAESIIEKLTHFSHWKAWSPWLLMDPKARVVISDDGRFYEWDGDRAGKGNMQIMEVRDQEYIRCDLEFLKPWRSKAEVYFHLHAKGEGSTEVTWEMDSAIPFFFFFMKKQMEAYVGMDYLRGFLMLKDYCETEAVPSKLKFHRLTDVEEFAYVGIRTSCNSKELSKQMSDDFAAVETFVQDMEEGASGNPFSIYHTWDMVNDRIEYTSALPVEIVPSRLPEGFVSGIIPELKAQAVQHKGPYRHLGNAWSCLYNMKKKKEFKWRKGIDPFEVYDTQPGQVPDEELLTTVYFPIK